jgi:hypothetical protein
MRACSKTTRSSVKESRRGGRGKRGRARLGMKAGLTNDACAAWNSLRVAAWAATSDLWLAFSPARSCSAAVSCDSTDFWPMRKRKR